MNEDTTYQPIGDLVLIRVDEPERETKSGILIKEDWKTLPPVGTVIAAGEDALVRFPMFVTGTTKVVFERYSSIILEDDLRLCRLSNILAFKHENVRD